MISPELLRRYPFFGFLTDAEYKAIALVADEVEFADGAEVFKYRQKAEQIYFLISGYVSNYFIVDHDGYKELYAGDVNPGELFGISALVEPYTYSTTLRANGDIKAIRIDAKALRASFEVDNRLGFEFMKALSGALMQRLQDARAQMAEVR